MQPGVKVNDAHYCDDVLLLKQLLPDICHVAGDFFPAHHVTSRRLTVGLDQRSYSTLGPVSAWMGDRLRAGKLSRYVTSHPGQLSLAIPLWVGAMSTGLGWEGNRRSGVALAMRHRH